MRPLSAYATADLAVRAPAVARGATRPIVVEIVTLDTMSTDCATAAALHRVLSAREGATCELAQYRRPKLSTGLDGKSYLQQALSSSSRKKLRQQRRRLAEKGTLASVVHRDA